MSTATTAKIISQAGKANPPSLVALYGGTLGERKAAITEIENDLQAVGCCYSHTSLNLLEYSYIFILMGTTWILYDGTVSYTHLTLPTILPV